MALNEDQINQLRVTLNSDGWNNIVLPALSTRGRMHIEQLLLDPAERTGECKGLDDNVIRARARAIEWLLSVLRNELAVADHNRRLDELDRQAQQDSPTANP